MTEEEETEEVFYDPIDADLLSPRRTSSDIVG